MATCTPTTPFADVDRRLGLGDLYTRLWHRSKSRNPRSHTASGGVIQLLSDRSQLLQDFAGTVDEDEFQTRLLLNAFSDMVQATKDNNASGEGSTPTRSIAGVDHPLSVAGPFAPDAASHLTANTMSQNTIQQPQPLPRHSENSYLSTPLRMKHFPSLSPSILRELLRSPPLRVPTPDIFMEDSSSSLPSQPDPELCYLCLHSVNSKARPMQQDDRVLYPLTPPQSTKIPASNWPSDFPEHGHGLVFDRCAAEKWNEFGGCKDTTSHLPLFSVETPSNLSHEIPDWTSEAVLLQMPSLSLVQPQNPDATTLEEEFGMLLLARATREEAEAAELVRLAERLKQLARDRRMLAKFFSIKTGSQHCSSRL